MDDYKVLSNEESPLKAGLYEKISFSISVPASISPPNHRKWYYWYKKTCLSNQLTKKTLVKSYLLRKVEKMVQDRQLKNLSKLPYKY